MKNVRYKYARIHAPKMPGVYRGNVNFLIFTREISGKHPGAVTCRRKFATEAAANIFYNGLHPDEKV